MTINNNLSPLPFFASTDEQSRKKWYAYGRVYPLITKRGAIPPFQIIREPFSFTKLNDANLYNANTGAHVSNFVTGINPSINILKYSDYDVITYAGQDISHFASLPVGRYYVRLDDGRDSYYSDVFCVVSPVTPLLTLLWRSLNSITFKGGRLDYSDNDYSNKLFFQTSLGKPEYEFTDEGTERDGIFFPEKQTTKKIYKFVVIANEPLLDVLRTVPLSDYIAITDEYGNTLNASAFAITPTWGDDGDTASVVIKFEVVDTIIKAIPSNIEGLGDFNNDFNQDFFKLR